MLTIISITCIHAPNNEKKIKTKMGIETSLPSTWTNDQEVHQERIKQDHGA